MRKFKYWEVQVVEEKVTSLATIISASSFSNGDEVLNACCLSSSIFIYFLELSLFPVRISVVFF